MKEYSFKNIKVGMHSFLGFKVTDKLIDNFCKLSGDYSDIHCSVDFAISRGFANRVAHGLLIGSFVSAFVGMELPGKYGLLQGVDLKFHRPCFPDDCVRVKGVVLNKIEVVKTIIVGVKVIRQDGILLSSGKAQVGLTI